MPKGYAAVKDACLAHKWTKVAVPMDEAVQVKPFQRASERERARERGKERERERERERKRESCIPTNTAAMCVHPPRLCLTTSNLM